MPRYFFDIHDGFDLSDDVGRELDDPQAVRAEALRVITKLSAAEGEDSDGFTIVLNVRDEQGNRALTLRMVCQIDDPAEAALRLAS